MASTPDGQRPVRIGVLGLDASHAVSLTRLLNTPNRATPLAGRARVVAACPGPVSPDFPPSHERADAIVSAMRDELAIPLVESGEELADRVDALVITAADPRAHPALFGQVAASGTPTAIVKILSADADSAREMVELANRHQAPLFAASPHRFGLIDQPGFAAAAERLRGADVQGRMPAAPPISAFTWYGAHLIDLLYAAMGPGCTEVTTATAGPDEDCLSAGVWADGRIGSIRGMADWPRGWKVDLHHDPQTPGDAPTISLDPTAGDRALLAGLASQLVEMTRTGRPPIDPAELVEVVRFAEAAEQSRVTGAPVSL